jgi:hypothetical protein
MRSATLVRGRAASTVLAAVALCVSSPWCPAETPPESEAAPVFEVRDLFESVRIPNITVATDGTVLAFAKSRACG